MVLGRTAHELLIELKANVSVDWAHRAARAHLRALVKRTVRRYVIPGVTE
ncbi:type I restriction enzyme endonuclease domain-containing protein [uncultured Bilophila sp.]